VEERDANSKGRQFKKRGDERKIAIVQSRQQHKATFEIWIIPSLHPKSGALL
jgi:hypothetical protein